MSRSSESRSRPAHSGTTVPPLADRPAVDPHQVRWHWIDGPAELGAWCRRWRQQPVLAIDTEFVRERTFYPHLGLLQVGDGRDIALIDPLAIDDLSPFGEVLEDESVVKILHSCSEDLEVFHHALGVLPRPLFDTQIAAGFAGLRNSMGLGKMVGELLGIDLPKGQTRSNWLGRPLSEAQLRYAALDVAYLLPIHEHLVSQLETMGRSHWAREDTERLLAPERFELDELAHFRKIGRGRRMRPRQLAVLRELVVWRERQARRRDLPRSFVLKDAALAALALRQPKKESELRRIRELDKREAKRHGQELVERISRALELPEDELPEPFPPSIDLVPHKKTVERLRKKTRQIAEELELAPELLASRRTVESLLRRWLDGRKPVLPSALRGWRAEVLGQNLVDLLDRGRSSTESD